MPPRDLTLESQWHFILVYLTAGPFLAGSGFGVATHFLPALVRRVFDRVALAGLPVLIAVVIALASRSGGWSWLFVLPYGFTLLGVMLTRFALALRAGAHPHVRPRGPRE